jgi:hypothetical protein
MRYAIYILAFLIISGICLSQPFQNFPQGFTMSGGIGQSGDIDNNAIFGENSVHYISSSRYKIKKGMIYYFETFAIETIAITDTGSHTVNIIGSISNIVGEMPYIYGGAYKEYTIAGDVVPTDPTGTANIPGTFTSGTYTYPMAGLLDDETHYKIAAYVSGSGGAKVGSPTLTFWTYSEEPEFHSTFTGESGEQIEVTMDFQNSSEINFTDGYMLICNECFPPTALPEDGVGYPVEYSFGDNNEGYVFDFIGPGITEITLNIFDDLVNGQTYFFKLVPYNWDGQHELTYNYKTSPDPPIIRVNNAYMEFMNLNDIILEDGATVYNRVLDYILVPEFNVGRYYWIEEGASCELVAQTSIKMTRGFHAKSGSSFKAKIEDDDPCVTGSPKQIPEKINISRDDTFLPQKGNNLQVYPNPNDGVFFVKVPLMIETPYRVELVNILGSILYSKSGITERLFCINIQNQPQGAYFIRVITGDSVLSYKIVYD